MAVAITPTRIGERHVVDAGQRRRRRPASGRADDAGDQRARKRSGRAASPSNPRGRTSSATSTSGEHGDRLGLGRDVAPTIASSDTDDEAADDGAPHRVEAADDGAGERAQARTWSGRTASARRRPAPSSAAARPESAPPATQAKRYTWLTGTPRTRATVGSLVGGQHGEPELRALEEDVKRGGDRGGDDERDDARRGERGAEQDDAASCRRVTERTASRCRTAAVRAGRGTGRCRGWR